MQPSLPPHPRTVSKFRKKGRLSQNITRLLTLLLVFALLTPTTLILPTPVYGQAVIQPPSFSLPHGYYSAPIQVTLSAEAGNQIRYTTDFSTPTATTAPGTPTKRLVDFAMVHSQRKVIVNERTEIQYTRKSRVGSCGIFPNLVGA